VAEVRAIGELPDSGQDTKSELLAGAALSGNDLVGVIDVTKVFDSLVFDSLVFDSLEGTRP
jgi:hypothetical protein